MTAHVGAVDWMSVAVIFVMWTAWLVAGTLFVVWVRGRDAGKGRAEGRRWGGGRRG